MTIVGGHTRPHHHVVQFYEQEDFLVDRVASFLAAGVREGEPCVVIATGEHNAMFADRLRSMGVATDAVTFLEARPTLDSFLRRGMPDGEEFRHIIRGAVTKAAPPAALTFLEARPSLDSFLRRGMPDGEEFRHITGGALTKAGGPAGRVRAYGEMVDLLWRDGA